METELRQSFRALSKRIQRRQTWCFRPARAEDFGELLALGRETFGSFPDEREWRWKYSLNPGGPAVSVVACDSGTGRIVAHLGALSMTAKVPGGSRRMSCLVDSMVAAPFRRKGLHFSLLWEVTQAVWENSGGFTYGLPNEKADRYTQRAGGRTQSVVPVFFKVLSWPALARAAFRRRPPSGRKRWKLPFFSFRRPEWNVDWSADFGADTDELWERAKEISPVLVRRDSAYLSWRFAMHPWRPYQILTARSGGEAGGYLVLRVMEKWGMKVGVIADLLVDPARPAAGSELLCGAADVARAEGAAVLCGALLLPAWKEALFRASGFRSSRLERTSRPFKLVIDTSVLSPSELRLLESSWYFTFGDTDLV